MITQQSRTENRHEQYCQLGDINTALCVALPTFKQNLKSCEWICIQILWHACNTGSHKCQFLSVKVRRSVFLDRMCYVQSISSGKLFLHIPILSHVQWACWQIPLSAKLRVKTEWTVLFSSFAKNTFQSFGCFVFSPWIINLSPTPRIFRFPHFYGICLVHVSAKYDRWQVKCRSQHLTTYFPECL